MTSKYVNNYWKISCGDKRWEFVFFDDRDMKQVAESFSKARNVSTMVRGNRQYGSTGRVVAWKPVLGFENVNTVLFGDI